MNHHRFWRQCLPELGVIHFSNLAAGLGLALCCGRLSAAPIDDQALTARLESEGRELVAGGRTAGNLRQQLQPETCQVKLATNSTASIEDAVAVVVNFYADGNVLNGEPSLKIATASGFFISESGALVTCYHVLASEKARGFVVQTRDGKVHPVSRVLAVSAADDLAIIQVEGSGYPALVLATNIPIGSTVSVVSHPRGHFYLHTHGTVSRYFTSKPNGRQLNFMTISAPFGDGSSGAPVLNERNEVVGVARATEWVNSVTDSFLQLVLYNCKPVEDLRPLISPPVLK